MTSAGGVDGGGLDRDTVPWRAFLAEAARRLATAGLPNATTEARWIVEEATGFDAAELVSGLDRPATVGGVARLDHLVARRLGGEPIQYVLGHWPFRHLDLLCDARVLIPRPETEQVAEQALRALDDVLRRRPDGHRATVVDLGTGTGAMGLAVASERPGSEVWLVDASPDAVAVARANLAGLGMAGSRVRVVQGSWFAPLPVDLVGQVDLVVTNPPYIGAGEDLDPAVADWEPRQALVAGPTGLECYREILDSVGDWLAPGGAFVAEVGADQARAVSDLVVAAGLVAVRVEPDHAGLDRVVLARRA